MSNKTHLRHSKWLQQQQQRRNRITAVLMVLLFAVLLVVAVAMVSTGHGVPPGVR
jgi:predicted nucleic acid-binding Zn ribbon protein